MKNHLILFIFHFSLFIFHFSFAQSSNPDGPLGSIVFHPNLLISQTRASVPGVAAPDWKSAFGFRVNLMVPVHQYFTFTFDWRNQPLRYYQPLAGSTPPPELGLNLKTWEFGIKLYLF